MKRLLSFLLVCSLILCTVPAVSASEVKNGIIDGYYYVDGEIQMIGLFKYNGDYYYASTTNGKLACDVYRYVAPDCVHSSAADMGKGWYTFGPDYKMVIETTEDPTDPPTEAPTQPSVPPSGGGTASPEKVFGVVNSSLTFASDVWTTVINVSGMWGYYFAAIVGLLLLRYLLRPIFGGRARFGSGQSDSYDRNRTRTDDD